MYKMNQIMKKLIISCLFCITCTVWAQKEPEVWSLQKCMEYAIENNLQIKQQELSLDEADIDVQNAFGAYLPNLNGSANNTWNSGLSRNPITNTNDRITVRNSSYSLSTRVPIFSGRQNYNLLQQAKLQKIANQYNIDTSKDNIRLQIANSYLQIVIQQENLEVLKAQHEITLEQLKRTQQLIDAGNLPKGDILELQATSATDIQNIANAENSVLISKTAMKQLLNLEFDKEFEVKKIEPSFDDLAVLEEPINRIISNVLVNRNEVKLAQQNVDISGQKIKLAKGSLYPSLSAFANVTTSETGRSKESLFTQVNDNFGFNYGLSMSIPVFNRFQNKNSVKRSKINKSRNEFLLEQTQQRLSRDVYQAYLDAKASNKAYEASKLAVTANEQAYEYAKNRFEVGISNSLDFTQAKIRFQNSQVQLIQSKYDLLFKLKLLELYVNGEIE